jgi:DNA-binding NarL/FixJ family response regulator
VDDVLIASDSPVVHHDFISVLASKDITVRGVNAGSDVRKAVAESPPDLVILDLQIGSMGGMAVCLDLRLEEGKDRIDRVPVLMLLDRRADVFLARRADVQGWLVKPLDPIRIRRAVEALLADGTWYDPSQRPDPVNVAAVSSTIADDAGK